MDFINYLSAYIYYEGVDETFTLGFELWHSLLSELSMQNRLTTIC